jgi:hypothetical protein
MHISIHGTAIANNVSDECACRRHRRAGLMALMLVNGNVHVCRCVVAKYIWSVAACYHYTHMCILLSFMYVLNVWL